MKGINKELLLLQSIKKSDYIKHRYNRITKLIKDNYGCKLVNKYREFYINDRYLDCEFNNGYLIHYKNINLSNTLISNLWRKFISRVKIKDNCWYMFIEDFVYQLLIIYSVAQDYLKRIDIVIDINRMLGWIEKPVVKEDAITYLCETLYYFTQQLILTRQYTIYMHLRGCLFINLQLWNLYFVSNKICYFYIVNTDINDSLQLAMTLSIKRVKNGDFNSMILSIEKNLIRAFDKARRYWEQNKYNELKQARLSYINNLRDFIQGELNILKIQYNVSDKSINHGVDYKRNGDINDGIKEIRKNMEHLPLLQA